jgi:ribosomal protein L40E
MKPVIIIAIAFVLLIPLFTIPVFGQGMQFYENKLYEISFSIPNDWEYSENVQRFDGHTNLVEMYPSNFTPLSNTDITPEIHISFENIATSRIPILNNQEIEKVELDTVREMAPNAKIINFDIKETSWGWAVKAQFAISHQDVGLSDDATKLYFDTAAFYFKDRESFIIGFAALDNYYDKYQPVFENLIDTLVLKGIEVNEPTPALTTPTPTTPALSLPLVEENNWLYVSIEEEQNWILILIGIVIAAAIASIVVRSRKRQTATPAKGSKTKKFCRKCGSSLDPKSKFCGKCGVSINPKK